MMIGSPALGAMPQPAPPPVDLRDRLLARYVATHPSVGAAIAGLERRKPYLRKLVDDHFPADRRAAILDLGCGHGALIWAARSAGYANIGGIDAAPEQVAMAAALGIDGVHHGDLMATLAATPTGGLDVVVLYDLFHYFRPEEQIAVIDEVLRVLKPGGRWIVHVPNGEALFSGRMRYWDQLAVTAFTRASITQLLLASGFAAVHCYEDRPVVHGVKSATRWILWRIMRGILRLALAAETGESGREAIFSQCLLAVAVKRALEPRSD